jgi:predicted nuclease of predicted toxin-antitoxin system
MHFKVDENLPIEVTGLLRQAGHEATTVLEQGLQGKPDSDIATACQREGQVLLTLDTDFADISAYPPRIFPGIIVLRLNRQDKPHALQVTSRLIHALSEHAVQNRLWIVEEERIRIRA